MRFSSSLRYFNFALYLSQCIVATTVCVSACLPGLIFMLLLVMRPNNGTISSARHDIHCSKPLQGWECRRECPKWTTKDIWTCLVLLGNRQTSWWGITPMGSLVLRTTPPWTDRYCENGIWRTVLLHCVSIKNTPDIFHGNSSRRCWILIFFGQNVL